MQNAECCGAASSANLGVVSSRSCSTVVGWLTLPLVLETMNLLEFCGCTLGFGCGRHFYGSEVRCKNQYDARKVNSDALRFFAVP